MNVMTTMTEINTMIENNAGLNQDRDMLVYTLKHLEYALFEIWEAKHSHMSSEEFDAEYGDLQEAAKKANLYLMSVQQS